MLCLRCHLIAVAERFHKAPTSVERFVIDIDISDIDNGIPWAYRLTSIWSVDFDILNAIKLIPECIFHFVIFCLPWRRSEGLYRVFHDLWTLLQEAIS